MFVFILNKMNSTNNKICRLCLKICSEDCETIQVATEEFLDILLVNMNFDVSDDRVSCKKCMEILQECFDFKSMCVHTEYRLITFLESKSINRTNMTEVYLEDKQNKNVNLLNTKEICRFCMKPIINYLVLDEVVDFKNLLQAFLPEVTLNFTSNPVGCSSCLDSLKSYCTFLKQLKRVEEHIRAYFEAESATKSKKVDLCNVVHLVGKNISTSNTNKDTVLTDLFVENFFSGLFLTKKRIKIQRNIRKQEDPKRFQCHSCNFKTKFKHNLSNHCRRFHGSGWFSCCYCKYRTQNEKCLEEHQELHDNNGKFKCSECKENYERKYHLDNHILKRHDNLLHLITSKIHSCIICNYKICKNTDLSQHMRIKHSQLEKYQCYYCLRDFSQKDHLETHISTAHLNLRPFICTICKTPFGDKVNLDSHILIYHQKNFDLMKTVTSKIYYCDHCTYKSVSKTRLAYHMKTHAVIGSQRKCLQKNQEVQDNKGKFICPGCKKNLKSRQAMDNHILKRHDNLFYLITSKIYSCNICNFKTCSKTALPQHVNTKHSQSKQYQCYHCLRTFLSKYNLQKHISSVHLNLRPAMCNACKKTFSFKVNLDRHIVSCHQKNFDLMKTVTSKIYCCDHCNYKTTFKTRLAHHMKTHAVIGSRRKCLLKNQEVQDNNGKFKCPECKQKFKFRLSMNNHILKYHDNLFNSVTSKIHSCSICNYKTCSKTALPQHMNTKHSQSKQYQCYHCLRTFLSKYNLQIHISSVHLNLRPATCNGCKKTFSFKVTLDRHIVSCHQKNLELMETVTSTIHCCDRCTYKSVIKTDMTRHMKTHTAIG